MSPTAFFLSLLLAWIGFYIAMPAWLVFRGWLLGGGLVQLFGALLPGIWHRVFLPEEAGNFGLLMLLLVPIPLGIIAAGLIAGLVRIGRWALQSVRRRLGLSNT